MKKKLLFLLTTLLVTPFVLTSCGDNSNIQIVDHKYDVAKVTISVPSVTLAIGNNVQIEAHVFDKNNNELNTPITWRSSNNNVAKVTENGFIFALGAGRAYIHAIAGYKTAVCVVSVPNPDVPIEDEFVISESDFTIKTGLTKQLYASLNGEKVTPTWVSSNPEVVSINDDGLINAVQSGTSKVTASYDKFQASILITVKDDAIVEFEITLNVTSLPMIIGEKVQIEATTSEPAIVNWSSKDSTIASVDADGFVKANGAGSTTITASANNKHAYCYVTVSEGEEDDKDVDIYFYLDYNNVDDDNPLAHFRWYQNVPLKGCKDLPADPDSSMASDPAFPYFIGWSSHTIIDSKDDIWDMDKDVVSGTYHMILYGIWSDVSKENFNV